MKVGSKRQAWLRASLHPATMAGLLLIVACWIAPLFVLSIARDMSIDGMIRRSDAATTLFEQQTEEVLRRLDQSLLLLRDSYEADPQRFDLRALAADAELLTGDTLQLARIDPDGFPAASTAVDSGPPLSVADRDYFSRQLDLSSDRLVIGEPLLGRATSKPSIKLSRRVRAPGGGFGGVMVVSVDPDFIAQFYRAIDLGKQRAVILRNPDGVILAAQGVSGVTLDRELGPQPLFEALARSASGHYWADGVSDGGRRLVAYRRSDRLPLIFSVSLAESDALLDYEANRKNVFTATWMISLLILVALIFNIRRQIKLDESGERLSSLNEEISIQNVRFDAALSNMSTGLCMFDADGNLLVWNELYVQMYGMSPELVRQGVNIRTIIEHRKQMGSLDLDVDVYIGKFRTELRENGKSRSSTRLFDGRVISVASTALADGGFVAIHEDSTERIHHERSITQQALELERINVQFDAALSHISQGISMFDRDKRLVVWNDRYAELYGLPETVLREGLHFDELMAELVAHHVLKGVTSQEAVMAIMNELSSDDHPSRILEFTDGRLILVSRQPMNEGGWVATHEDVTERKRAEAEIAHMARHDVLTGLPNRAEFNARLNDASQRVRRGVATVSLLLLDLDKFKAVNDTLGHPAGDQLLIEVGARLQSTLRETDVLARLGGDEFAIIQAGGVDLAEGAIALAQRIIGVIMQPFDLSGHRVNIGASIGIALAPEHGVDPEPLLTAADLALYAAKSNGRNDYRLFEARMLEAARTQKWAEVELREAIARQQFELFYQPVVDVKRHLMCGVEALIRWRHPAKGLVGPDQFIPLAESCGLIAPLGEWIIRQACADAARLPDHVKVAINISAVQFRKGNLFEIISQALRDADLPPDRIELELTETSHLENQETILANMLRLKRFGVSIALDDFGQGYSSMNYLTNFPFDKIKIDKSFTQGALDRHDCAAVVASTLALSRGLGIVTTAEGVENEQQFEYMRDAGVDLVQGCLFGRPVPIAEFATQVAKTSEVITRLGAPLADDSTSEKSKRRA